MNEKFENMDELVNKLTGMEPDAEFKIVENVVDEIVRLGGTDKVHAFDDDYLGLKCNLSPEFLKESVEEADTEEFEAELYTLLEQASCTIYLTERDLSEEQIEDVAEDRIGRGVDKDDFDS